MKLVKKKIIIGMVSILCLISGGLVWYYNSINTRGTYIDYIKSYYAPSRADGCYHEYIITESCCIKRTFYCRYPEEFEYEFVYPISKWRYIRLLRQAVYKEKFFTEMEDTVTRSDSLVEVEIYYEGEKKRIAIDDSDLESMLADLCAEAE